jgi:hypothetical protein
LSVSFLALDPTVAVRKCSASNKKLTDKQLEGYMRIATTLVKVDTERSLKKQMCEISND